MKLTANQLDGDGTTTAELSRAHHLTPGTWDVPRVDGCWDVSPVDVSPVDGLCPSLWTFSPIWSAGHFFGGRAMAHQPHAATRHTSFFVPLSFGSDPSFHLSQWNALGILCFDSGRGNYSFHGIGSGIAYIFFTKACAHMCTTWLPVLDVNCLWVLYLLDVVHG